LVFNALQLPALLLLVHEPDDLILYAILGLPFALLGVAYNLWHIHRHRLAAALWSLRPSLTGAKALLREAWPLALVQAAVLTNFNGATIILGFADEDDAVGQYVTGLRLMMVAAVVTAAMWNAYFPAFARVQGSPTQAVSLSREYLSLLAWIGLPAAALGWATGRHIVDLMYGTAFAASGRYFEWLCLFIGLNFLNYGFSGIFVPWGYNRLGLKVSGFSAIINVAACLLTIPSYGAWGAIFAMIASEFAIMVLGLAYRWQQQIFWHPILPIVVPPLLCSSAVALAIAAAPSSFDRYWWLQLLAGAVVLAACAAGFQRRVLLNLVRFILRRGGTTSAEAIRS
jgi:O-antigen/teichoic acid export membrane protein